MSNSNPQQGSTIEDKLNRLVHAIRNDGWNNGFNTDDKPWVDQLQAIITTETTRLGASEKHQCGTKPHNKQADTLGAKLLAAIGASGNEFAMGYDDSGDYWHFHSGVRGNGRMLFGTEFNSESCEIEEALEEYLNHIGVSDMLATNSKPPSGESDAPSNALQKEPHDS